MNKLTFLPSINFPVKYDSKKSANLLSSFGKQPKDCRGSPNYRVRSYCIKKHIIFHSDI